ncbi:IS110 family transposase [Streptomyces sp. PSKA30]|uniref:IS110 family transposase n=1 Tax=Streptomyces sp. PSKA30 TaxID=2874597 RepID=UPI001CD116A7|nr:IS110 family transposase [Streptomyces sp. PSKA30]MBZ9642241.1 IS110 family transposase [Streptomyces sp. PSKA30]
MDVIPERPGRKTDVKDSEWIARLVECGLVRPSCVPPEPIRQLRDLTRYRTEVIRERTREASAWRSSWRTPGSSCPPRWSTSWAFPAARCWRPSSPANATRRCSRTWPRAACAARRTPSSRP